MNKINVTQSDLPELKELIPYLEKIWKSKFLTNGGPFHEEFEAKLCDFLGVKYISLFSNATIALITALRALDIKGEVITTPYSFVATTHAISWNENTPVFVDIEPENLNINVNKIEKAITSKTKAIMPVHCYGNMCRVEEIQKIADKYNLKIIYDAAHAFGVKNNNKSILNYGDLSIVSFHATKVFNTFEGGAIISNNIETKNKIDKLKNFGIDNEVNISSIGINGKMNEFNAALGLLQMPRFSGVLSKRSKIFKTYENNLKNKGVRIIKQNTDCPNYSYVPIIIDESYPISRDDLYEKLKENNIYSRRYFYPLLSNIDVYKELQSANLDNLPVANDIVRKVLCLPIYPDLGESDLARIINIVNNPLENFN